MVVAKQVDVRANLKKFLEMAYNGEPVVIPRKENKNVVIISEDRYHELEALSREFSYAKAISSVSVSRPVQTGSAVTDVKTFNLNKLNAIQSLKDGWNGNGAPAIPDVVIAKVRDIIEHIDIQPEIFPTALETIQLEFDNSRRDHMEIEIGAEDSAEIFIVDYAGGESTEELPSDAAAIHERVMKFYG